MPADKPSAARSAAEVDELLPKGMLVRRGHIRFAFGLSAEDMKAMVPTIFRPVQLNLPPNKRRSKAKKRGERRAFFLRVQVMAVARQWEKQT